eukprot:TRINITY_DN45509_c0_g1_i1.p2 TRINITY_DN45509_c0_g1~~TRINITY_DN45509_c0_g1_i1.p2  ORF type:complete len:380 (+),score=63.94 TRINITY_DN45509_c0_g1_i1:42-1181(+)
MAHVDEVEQANDDQHPVGYEELAVGAGRPKNFRLAGALRDLTVEHPFGEVGEDGKVHPQAYHLISVWAAVNKEDKDPHTADHDAMGRWKHFTETLRQAPGMGSLKEHYLRTTLCQKFLDVGRKLTEDDMPPPSATTEEANLKRVFFDLIRSIARVEVKRKETKDKVDKSSADAAKAIAERDRAIVAAATKFSVPAKGNASVASADAPAGSGRNAASSTLSPIIAAVADADMTKNLAARLQKPREHGVLPSDLRSMGCTWFEGLVLPGRSLAGIADDAISDQFLLEEEASIVTGAVAVWVSRDVPPHLRPRAFRHIAAFMEKNGRTNIRFEPPATGSPAARVPAAAAPSQAPDDRVTGDTAQGSAALRRTSGAPGCPPDR